MSSFLMLTPPQAREGMDRGVLGKEYGMGFEPHAHVCGVGNPTFDDLALSGQRVEVSTLTK